MSTDYEGYDGERSAIRKRPSGRVVCERETAETAQAGDRDTLRKSRNRVPYAICV